MNKTLLIGNIGHDPELRTFPSGDKIASVSLCTTEKWRDKNTGEIKTIDDWHKLVFRGHLAEIVGQYVRKGAKLYVEGKSRTRKYSKDGRDVYVTEILVDEMEMLDRPNRQGGGDQQGNHPRQGGGQPQQGHDDHFDDDPFGDSHDPAKPIF